MALQLPSEYAQLTPFIIAEQFNNFKLNATEDDPTPEILQTYIVQRIAWYTVNSWFGGQLHEYYQDDFKNWNKSMIDKCSSSIINLLSDYLVKHGVYIPRDRKIPNSVKLLNILSEDDVHEWTEQEISHQIKHGGGFSPKFDPWYGKGSPESRKFAQFSQQDNSQGIQDKSQDTSIKTLPADSPINGQNCSAYSPRTVPLQINYGLTNQLTDLRKLYYDKEQKYGGDMWDVPSNKLLIYKDYCSKVGLMEEQYHNGISIMLKGRASLFYYQNLANKNLNFEEMIARLKSHYETEQNKQEYLSLWRDTTLQSVIAQNPTKKVSECFQILLDKLQKVHEGLVGCYNINASLKDHLLNACVGIKECELALFNPANTFDAVTSQLRSAIYTREKQAINSQYIADPCLSCDSINSEQHNEQYYLDRKYRGGNKFQPSGHINKESSRPNNHHGKSRDYQNNFPKSKQTFHQKKCFICGNSGCWSTLHSVEGRKKVFSKFRNAAFQNGLQSTPDMYGSFLAEWEGMEGITNSEEDEMNQFLLDFKNATENWITDFGSIDPIDTLEHLNNQSALHVFSREDIFTNTGLPTKCSKSNSVWKTNSSIVSRYSDCEFHGIIPDTGAAGVSTAGHPQVIAFQRQFPNVKIDESRAGEHQIRFGKGEATSLDTIEVDTPVGNIVFHVVPLYTPFLFCLQDMKHMNVYLDNLQNMLLQGEKMLPIIMKFGHPWMLLRQEQSIVYCHLTETELRQLHRRFGHPSVKRLKEILERAGHDVQNDVVEKINRYCHQCQIYGKSPGRFRFRLPKEYNFNYAVIIDIFNLEGSNVFHVVDEATAYQSAKFLIDMSAAAVWNAFRSCWIDVYLGPPDCIIHDAGTNLASREFRQNASSLGIQVEEVPVEAHNSIGKVERYHYSLRRAYQIINDEIKDQNVSKEMKLQMALKAINDTIGPHGLVPTLLVFGAYPRISKDSAPAPTITARAQAIQKAMKDLHKIQAERSVKNALNARNGPNTLPVLSLPLQSEVLVWRENKGWKRPFKLLAVDVDHQECTLEMPYGPTRFRATVVKPYHRNKKLPVSG